MGPIAHRSASFLVLCATLALGGCAPDGGAGSTPGGSGGGGLQPGGGDDDDDTGQETHPPALTCDGGELAEIQLVDIWGRPLDGVGATDDAAATLGPLQDDCAPLQWLQCGGTVRGDNGGPDSTDVIDGWRIGVGNYRGSEVAYAWRATADGPVTWELIDPRPLVANQDLFVLQGSSTACRASDVIQRGFNDVTFEARAGETYFLVLDSFPGEEGPYEVRLDCGPALNDAALPSGPDAFAQLAEQPDGPFSITYSAPDYLPTTVTGRIVDGRFQDVQVTGTARAAQSWDDRLLPGATEACRVNTLYVGLDHAWYAASAPRPPRAGNELDLYLSGEEMFGQVHTDLSAAKESLHLATWWWESDFELARPGEHWLLTEAERFPQTILAMMQAQTWMDSKVMVSRFCDDDCFGWADWITIDGPLVDAAETVGDTIEVALQGNPTEVPLFGSYEPEPVLWWLNARLAEQPEFGGRTFLDLPEPNEERFDAPIASYHQKMMTLDGRVAFVSGMNVKGTDWDTTAHEVFDPRRMNFESDVEDRAAVLALEETSDLSPRKDYGLRVEGPLVADVDAVLSQRWSQAISAGEPYTELNTPWTPPPPANESFSGVEAQFQVTLPIPSPERSILESLRKALSQAQEFVYIEDQYWRVPLLNEVLLETLEARPQVKLVVVTSPISTLDPSAWWTALSDEAFRERVPDQYVTFTTKSFDWAPYEGWFSDGIDTFLVQHSLHSKLVIVDDRYLSVGSANKNNRGLLYEGEANVAVLDETWVREQRVALLTNLLGPEFAPSMTDDFDQTFALLKEAAAANDAAVRWWEANADDLDAESALASESVTWPSGFLFPLELPTTSVVRPGPDAF
jgi:phosphatidylserine/phosphatidylglycerophosphate/cardiolipin synthase-like enzyme